MSSEDRLDLASAAFDQSEYAESLQLVEGVLEDEPRSQPALILKAASLAGLNKYDDFEESIDQAIEIDPSVPLPHIIKSLALVANDWDIPGAITAGEAAVKVGNEVGAAWNALAFALNYAGRAAEAIAPAKRAVELEPETPSFWRTLARVEFDNDNPEEAIKAYDRALELDPDHASALAMKAAALGSLGQVSEALPYVERAYELDPALPDVLFARGGLSIVSGAFDQAETMFTEWLDLEPETVGPWRGFAFLYLTQEKFEQALDALRRALALDPHDLSMRRWLGTSYLGIGDEARALEVFSALVEDGGSEADWLGKSVAERELGFSEAAIDSSRKALSMSAFRSGAAWAELARAYGSTREHQNAWRAYSEAAAIDPHNLEAAIGLAVESLSSHNETRAQEELIEAEERLGPHALIEFNRGVAHYRLGKESLATAAWRRAHRLDPNLNVAEVLVSSYSSESRLGGWVEHWFGSGATRNRKVGGAALVAGLLFFLLDPVLEPDLIPGFVTGRLTIEAYVPALVLALLLLLPTIRGLAVGGVSVDVAPISTPDQHPKIDPDQILPTATLDTLDVGRMIVR